ncbi:unnamed protein product [Effrenium voratum]|nr:unnamed protein product [Effrenium voratum]
MSEGAASSTAVRRLRRELEALKRSNNSQILVRPAEDNLLEWHFLLHSFPHDSPYSKGCYHGKIIFPAQYPHAPPAIVMMTPSGRLDIGKKLCLSMTDFHPESWNPAWSLETILVGLLSFFMSEEGGYGSVQASPQQRQALAEQSWEVNAASELFRSLFPDFVSPEVPAPAEPAPAEPAPAEPEPAQESPMQSSFQSAVESTESPVAADSAASAEREAVEQIPQGSQVPQVAQVAPVAEAEPERPQGAQVAPESDLEAAEEPMECWICRDVTAEPLIQPCRCRGSMSGVHASCVEEWIRIHRRTANTDAPPQCSVCHEPYHGSERMPGVRDFLAHTCQDMGSRCLRTVLLVFMLLAYQVCAMDDNLLLPLRVGFFTFFGLLFVYRVLVLLVSLPAHRLPPAQPLVRFFVSEPTQLALHIAEAFTTLLVMTTWAASGFLDWRFYLPFGVTGAFLAAKLFYRRPSAECCRRCGHGFLFILMLPLILIWGIFVLCRKYRHLVLHPLGPGLHICAAIAVIPMAFTLQSNLALLILWGTHALFAVASLVELFCIQKFRWKKGFFWLLLVQVAVMACYTANLCVFPAGVGNQQQSVIIVTGSSFSWLLLLIFLSLKVNWQLCMQQLCAQPKRNMSALWCAEPQSSFEALPNLAASPW